MLHPVAHETDGMVLGLDLGIRTGSATNGSRIGPVKVFSDGR